MENGRKTRQLTAAGSRLPACRSEQQHDQRRECGGRWSPSQSQRELHATLLRETSSPRAGERSAQTEETIPHEDFFKAKRIDTQNVEFAVQLPPTTVDKKYDLYVTILRKSRRYE